MDKFLIKEYGLDNRLIYYISTFLIYKEEYDNVIKEIDDHSCHNTEFTNTLYRLNRKNKTYCKSTIWWPSVHSMSYIVLEELKDKELIDDTIPDML